MDLKQRTIFNPNNPNSNLNVIINSYNSSQSENISDLYSQEEILEMATKYGQILQFLNKEFKEPEK